MVKSRNDFFKTESGKCRQILNRPNNFEAFSELRDGPLFFIGGGGVPFLGPADNFFLKSNVFQTLFSLHFVMKTIFFTTIFKNVTGFFIDLI